MSDQITDSFDVEVAPVARQENSSLLHGSESSTIDSDLKAGLICFISFAVLLLALQVYNYKLWIRVFKSMCRPDAKDNEENKGMTPPPPVYEIALNMPKPNHRRNELTDPEVKQVQDYPIKTVCFYLNEITIDANDKNDKVIIEFPDKFSDEKCMGTDYLPSYEDYIMQYVKAKH